MDKREIIREVFVDAPAMAEHLCIEGNLDDDSLLQAICGAPISIRRKLELLKDCESLSLHDYKGQDLKTDCQGLILAIERAFAALKTNPGDFFLWDSNWYDPENRDNCRNGDPCIGIEAVFEAIQKQINDWAEDQGEQAVWDSNWFTVQKWEQQT